MRKILAASFGDSIGDDALRSLVPLLAVTLVGIDGFSVGVLGAIPFLWFLLGSTFIPQVVGPEKVSATYQRVAAVEAVTRTGSPALVAVLLRFVSQAAARRTRRLRELRCLGDPRHRGDHLRTAHTRVAVRGAVPPICERHRRGDLRLRYCPAHRAAGIPGPRLCVDSVPHSGHDAAG